MTNGSTTCWPFVAIVFATLFWPTSGGSIDKNTNEHSNVYHHPNHQSRMQVFVQTPTELRLVIDGLTIQSAADLVDYALLNGVAMQNPSLRFEPGEVDFGDTEFATAAQRRVTVHNPSNAVVHLLTITGSTTHYHCSFFEDNILFPGANTSFDIYFLPRERGNLSSVLEVHTSVGIFTLKLRGYGIDSRYHILPAITMKLPTNASFIYMMSLYNPFPRSVQIEEIFSSSAELHLELVTGNAEEDSKLWHLQPYETRPIFFVQFKGREATHFIAYVVIVLKSSNGKNSELEKLFIPVDFEVFDGVGLFPSNPILDFGIVNPSSPILTIPLTVWNGYSRPVLVQNVSVIPPNPAIIIDTMPARLTPDYLRQQTVAFVSLDTSLLTSRQQLFGDISIVVKGNQNNTSNVSYRIRYVSGNLQAISPSDLLFNCQEGHCDWHARPRFIALANRAKSQIILYSVINKGCKDGSPYQLFLNVQTRNLPTIFAPSQSHEELFSINVRKVSSEDSRTSYCSIVLSTNIGIVKLPIHVWDGKLEVRYHFTPASNFFTHDVSLIYTGNEDGPVVRTLSLFNPNPVVVRIRKFDAISPYVFARVLGVSNAPKGNVYLPSNYRSVKEVILLSGEVPVPPGHYALIEFFVNATEPPAIDSLTNILMWVVTDQPNRTPINGAILFDYGNYFSYPDPLLMKDCFPGKICNEPLVLSHTYRNDPYQIYPDEDNELRPHQLQFIEFLPDETGFSYKFDGSYIYYGEKNQIATISYDASEVCGDFCYIGLSETSSLYAHWLSACNLDSFSVDIDSYLLVKMRKRWNDMLESGKNIVNVTLALLTAENMPHLTMPHHSFLQVQLTVPKLIQADKDGLNFNVVEVGQFDMLNFTVSNPTGLPLAIQIVLMEFYPSAASKLLPIIFDQEFDVSDGLKDDRNAEHPVFSFLDLNFTVSFNKLLTRNPSQYSQPFPSATRCSRRSVTAILRPNTNFTVHVRFAPSQALEYKSAIILRNNLTFVEALPIRGQGGKGDLVLADSKGRQLDKIELTYSASQLSECSKDTSFLTFITSAVWYWLDDESSTKQPLKSPYSYASLEKHPMEPAFTIRRALALRNMGRLPVYVTSVTAFGSSSGLRLTDISGTHNHVIPTNGTINFQIAFSPDFYQYRYMWTLAINSTIGTTRYPVIVTLPPNLIANCRSALPRPDWEPMLRLTVIFIIIPNVIGALLFALCDAYYITSIVRQLKYQFNEKQRQHGNGTFSVASTVVQSSGKVNRGVSGQKSGQQARKIQIRVGDTQSVTGTVISEPKLSRKLRIFAFWRKCLVHAPKLIWQYSFGFLFNMFRKNKSSHDQISDIAARDAGHCLNDSIDDEMSRSKSVARQNRRTTRATGFRRLYGQILPSESQASVAVVDRKTPVGPSTSGDEDFLHKISRQNLSTIENQPSPSDCNSRRTSSRQNSKEIHPQNDFVKESEGIEGNSLDEAATGKDSIDRQGDPAMHQESSVITRRGDGRNDGQSADDECSSLSSEEENVNETFDRKTSPLPPKQVTGSICFSNTSDDENYVNKPSTPSSSSNESNSVSMTSNLSLRNSVHQQKQKHILPHRFQTSNPQGPQHATASGLQGNDWHIRKQQRLSEQPPRLQRRLITNPTPGSPVDPSADRRSQSSKMTKLETTEAPSLQRNVKQPPIAATVFYRGVPSPLTGDPVISSPPSRPVNTPYLIAEATMKRVMGSHISQPELTNHASTSSKENSSSSPNMSLEHTLSAASTWTSPSPTNLSVRLPGPSIAEALLFSASQAEVLTQNQLPSSTATTTSTNIPSWLAAPSTFSASSADFIPSATAKRLANETSQPSKQLPDPPTANNAAAIPSTSIPAISFAASLIDSETASRNVPSRQNTTDSLLSNEFLFFPTNNNETSNTSSTWSWGASDSIWNPASNSQVENSWDPWAAQIVKSLWGSPDKRNDDNKDKEDNFN